VGSLLTALQNKWGHSVPSNNAEFTCADAADCGQDVLDVGQ